jgi:hypothetical protein
MIMATAPDDTNNVRFTVEAWCEESTRHVYVAGNDQDLPKDKQLTPGRNADRAIHARLAQFGKLPEEA